jgi:addiction module HigA family antidote
MTMHNPPHPGEFIQEVFLSNLEMSRRSVALKLGVSPSTFLRLVKGQSGISPEMALRLSKGLGRSPESWLAMQHNYDLWHARKRIDIDNVEPIPILE